MFEAWFSALCLLFLVAAILTVAACGKSAGAQNAYTPPPTFAANITVNGPLSYRVDNTSFDGAFTFYERTTLSVWVNAPMSSVHAQVNAGYAWVDVQEDGGGTRISCMPKASDPIILVFWLTVGG